MSPLRLLQRNRVQCPICGHRDRDYATFNGRPKASCRGCDAKERHRLLWVWLTRSGILDGEVKTIRHFAPERGIAKKLRALPGVDYRSADLLPGKADEQADVTDIPWPDGSIDMLICSHVLEHVPDDRRAMRELFRVLAPGGYALLEVPIITDVTFEDPSITDPEERLRVYGHRGHVRSYGQDYYDRLREAGFTVEQHDVRKLVTDEDRERYGLWTYVDFAKPDDDLLWEVVVCRRHQATSSL